MKLAIKDFFQDIRNFFTFSHILGIDIGTVSLKLVEVSRQGDRLVLNNYGILETKEYLERENAALQGSSLEIELERIGKLLNQLISEVKPKARRVVASLPLSNVFVVPIEMPILSSEETARSVAFQARQYVPLRAEDMQVEWSTVEEIERGGERIQKILITAIPKKLIRRYQDAFKQVGLSLVAVEVDITAAARALAQTTNVPTLLIDIGGLSTAIAVVEKGILKHVGQIDYAGATLTNAVAHVLGVSPRRAEELKRRRGLLGFGGEYELSTSLLPFLDVIIRECTRVKEQYENSYQKKVGSFTIVGGGADLPGISDYFVERVRLPFEEPAPLRYFSYASQLAPLSKTLNRQLNVAAGLALRTRLS